MDFVFQDGSLSTEIFQPIGMSVIWAIRPEVTSKSKPTTRSVAPVCSAARETDTNGPREVAAPAGPPASPGMTSSNPVTTRSTAKLVLLFIWHRNSHSNVRLVV
jgi:hypothetical protein